MFLLTSKVYSFVLRHLQNYPAPIGLNLSWTFGSLSMLALILQIATGLCLSMHYIPGIDVAFDSVEHIVRDVRGGHFLRYAHSNGASFYFICVYSHILRSLYYKSFIENKSPWNIGILIFAASMAAAFLGYVLPWGQMSFWGATVITNLFSVVPFVGTDIVHFLWGGFGVGGPTLNRFYTLHFIIPLIILALVIVHILALHENGSTTPYRGNWGDDTISFFTYYIIKDLYLIGYFLAIFLLFLIYAPNYLNHPDNYNKADPMKTPPHIVPEWYFLPFYAILRAIPNKTLGVVAMGASIAFLALLPPMGALSKLNMTYSANDKIVFWTFVLTSAVLGFLGSMPIETPFVQMSWMFCQLYFLLGLAIGGASWLFGNRYSGSKNEVYKSQILNHKNRQIGQVFVYLWLFHNSVMLMKNNSGRGEGYWRRGRFYRINENSWRHKKQTANNSGPNAARFEKKPPRNNTGDSLNFATDSNRNEFWTKRQQPHSRPSERVVENFKTNRQKQKKTNRTNRAFNFHEQEIVEVEVYYEVKAPQTATATPQVIDIYVDENNQYAQRNHLGEILYSRAGEVKLLPYIEQQLVAGDRIGKSKALSFIDKITSYIVENYKCIIANLSLLIVFALSLHIYLTSESFNCLLNSGIRLRRAFSGCVWNVWFFIDENVRALLEVILILKSLWLSFYLKCQTVFVGTGWHWDESFSNTFPEFFDYLPITTSRYEYGLEKLIFLKIERLAEGFLSLDATYKINAVLEYIIAYYGQIVYVSMYEKFLFSLIVLALVLSMACLVFWITNLTVTVLLPTTVVALPFLWLIYILQFYDFTESWLFFRIDESFKNTNLYSSGNFFITNSAMAGFERYGSLQLPWSIHENSFGWGPTFSKQTQADKIRERDRVMKDANFVNSTVPNLNSDPVASGTFWNRTVKGRQRAAYLWESLKRAVYYSENFLNAEREKYLRVGHQFLDGGGKLTPLLNYRGGGLQGNTVPGTNFPILSGGRAADLSFVGQNDFLLPSKNNIISQTGAMGSTESIRRKRALSDTPKHTKANFIPTKSGASSHLFEKNMQDEKSLEMNVKSMLESTATDLWDYSDAGSIDLLPLENVPREVVNSQVGDGNFLVEVGEVLNKVGEVSDTLNNNLTTYGDLFYTNLQTNFHKSEWYLSRSGGRGKIKSNFKSSGSVFVEGFASGNSLLKGLTYAKDISGLYLGKYRYGGKLTDTPHMKNMSAQQKNANRRFTPASNERSIDLRSVFNSVNLSVPPNSSIVAEVERCCKTLQVTPTPENIIDLLRLAVFETIIASRSNSREGLSDTVLSVMYTWFGKLGVMACWNNRYRHRLRLILLSSVLLEPYGGVTSASQDISQLDESLVEPYKYLYGNEHIETLSRILSFTKKRIARQNRSYITNFFKLHPSRNARSTRGAYGRNVFAPKMKKSKTPLAIKFNVTPNSHFTHYINKKHPLDYAITYSETLSVERTRRILVTLVWNTIFSVGSFFGNFFYPVRDFDGRTSVETYNLGIVFKTPRVRLYDEAGGWFYAKNYFENFITIAPLSRPELGQFNALTRPADPLSLASNLRVKKREIPQISMLPNPVTISRQFNFMGLLPIATLDHFRYLNNLTTFRKYWSGATPKNNQPTGGFTKEMPRASIPETASNNAYPVIYGFFFDPKRLHTFKKSPLPGVLPSKRHSTELTKQLRSTMVYAIIKSARNSWTGEVFQIKKYKHNIPVKLDASLQGFRRKKYLNKKIWRLVKKKQNKLTRLNFNLQGFFAMFENRSRRISLFMAYFVRRPKGTGFKYTVMVGPGGDILKFKPLYINLISNWDKPIHKKNPRDMLKFYLGRYSVTTSARTRRWRNVGENIWGVTWVDSTFFKKLQTSSISYSDIFKKVTLLDQVESEKAGLLLEHIGRNVSQQTTLENFPNKISLTTYSKDSSELIPLAPASITFRYLLNDVWYRSGNDLDHESVPGRRRRRNKKSGFGNYRRDARRNRRARPKKKARIRAQIKTGNYDINPSRRMLGRYELSRYKVKKKIRGALSGIYAISEADINTRTWSESWRLAQDRHQQTLLYQTRNLSIPQDLFKVKNAASLFNFLAWGNLNQTKALRRRALNGWGVSVGGWVVWVQEKYSNLIRLETQQHVANKLGGYFFQPLQVQKNGTGWSANNKLIKNEINPISLQVDKLGLKTHDYYTEAKDRYQTDLKLANLFSTNHVDFLDPLREIINEDIENSLNLFNSTRTLAPYIQTKTQGKLANRSFLEYGNSHTVGIENNTGVSTEWDWKTYFSKKERSSSLTFSNSGPNSLRTISYGEGADKNLKLSQDGGRNTSQRHLHHLFKFVTWDNKEVSARRNELQYYEKSIGEGYETVLDNFISLDWTLAGRLKKIYLFSDRFCDYRPDFSFLQPTIRLATKIFPRILISTSWVFMFGIDDLFSLPAEIEIPEFGTTDTGTVVFLQAATPEFETLPRTISSEELTLAILEFYREDFSHLQNPPYTVGGLGGADTFVCVENVLSEKLKHWRRQCEFRLSGRRPILPFWNLDPMLPSLTQKFKGYFWYSQTLGSGLWKIIPRVEVFDFFSIAYEFSLTYHFCVFYLSNLWNGFVPIHLEKFTISGIWGWAEVWIKLSLQPTFKPVGRFFLKQPVDIWDEKQHSQLKILLLNFADYIFEEVHVRCRHPAVDLSKYPLAYEESSTISTFYYLIEMFAEHQPKDLRSLYDLPLLDIYSYHSRLTDPNTIYFLMEDFWDFTYRWTLGTFRYHLKEYFKFYWRKYTPFFENLREMLAAEMDDNELDIETMTEEYEPSDIAEDDPDIVNFEGIPMGDLYSGSPSLLIKLVDYASDSFQVLELENIFHYLVGLDSVDGAGLIEREFDINLIIRSLWAVDVLFYAPYFGGFALVNFSALLDFITIIFLDQRGFFSSLIYYWLDESRYVSLKLPSAFWTIKVFDTVDGLIRASEYFYFSVSDFSDGFFLYLNFVFNVYGIWVLLVTFILLLFFGKINLSAERAFRTTPSRHFSIANTVLLGYNLFLFKNLYYALSNLVVLLRMVSMLLLLSTVGLLLIDGFRIAGISRLYIVDRGDLKYLNGLFFSVERDPFVEKHVPVDEVWDEFKYDSAIDEDYDKYHFIRKRAELFGGPIWESGAMVDASGFAKNFDWGSEDGPGFKEKDAGQQEHNRFIDENSYVPGFVERTENEHDYIYDFEAHDNVDRDGIGALSYEDDDLFDDEEGSDEEEEMNPKTIHERQEIIKHEGAPLIFRGSKVGLVDRTTDVGGKFNFTGQVLANNKLYNLIARKQGEMQTDPVEDSSLLEEPDLGDIELELSDRIFWNSAFGDPITQYNRNSLEPNVDWPVPFNYNARDKEDIFKEEAYRLKKLGGRIGFYKKRYHNKKFYTKTNYFRGFMRTASAHFKNPKKPKKRKIKPKLKWNILNFSSGESSNFFEQLLAKKKTTQASRIGFNQMPTYGVGAGTGSKPYSGTFKNSTFEFPSWETSGLGEQSEEGGSHFTTSSFLKIKHIKKKLKYGPLSPIRSWRFLDLSAENTLRATPVSEFARSEKFSATKVFYIPKSPLRKETVLLNRRGFRQIRDKSLSIFYKYQLRRQNMKDRRIQKFADIGSGRFEKRSFRKGKSSPTVTDQKPTKDYLKKNIKKKKSITRVRAPIQLPLVGYRPFVEQKLGLGTATNSPSRHQYEKIVSLRGRALDGIYKKYRPKGRKKKLWVRDIPGSLLYANDFILFNFLDRRNRNTPWRAKRKESRKAFNLTTRYWGDNDFRHTKPKILHPYRQTYRNIKIHPKELQKLESKIYKNELSYFLEEVKAKKKEWHLDDRVRAFKKDNSSAGFIEDAYLMRLGVDLRDTPAKLSTDGKLKKKKTIIVENMPAETTPTFYRLGSKTSPRKELAGVLQKNLKLKFLRESLQKQNLKAVPNDPESALVNSMLKVAEQSRFKKLKVLSPSRSWSKKRSKLALKYKTVEPAKIYLKNHKRVRKLKLTKHVIKIKNPKVESEDSGTNASSTLQEKTTGKKITWGSRLSENKSRDHITNSQPKFADWKFIFKTDKKVRKMPRVLLEKQPAESKKQIKKSDRRLSYFRYLPLDALSRSGPQKITNNKAGSKETFVTDFKWLSDLFIIQNGDKIIEPSSLGGSIGVRLGRDPSTPIGNLGSFSENTKGGTSNLKIVGLTRRIGGRSSMDMNQKITKTIAWKPTLGDRELQVGARIRQGEERVSNEMRGVRKKRIRMSVSTSPNSVGQHLFKIKKQHKGLYQATAKYKKKNHRGFIEKKTDNPRMFKDRSTLNTRVVLTADIGTSPKRRAKFYNGGKLPQWAKESISRDSSLAKQELFDLLGGLSPKRPKLRPMPYKFGPKQPEIKTIFKNKRESRIGKYFRQLLYPRGTWDVGPISEDGTFFQEILESATASNHYIKLKPKTKEPRWEMFGAPLHLRDKRPHGRNAATWRPPIFLTNRPPYGLEFSDRNSVSNKKVRSRISTSKIYKELRQKIDWGITKKQNAPRKQSKFWQPHNPPHSPDSIGSYTYRSVPKLNSGTLTPLTGQKDIPSGQNLFNKIALYHNLKFKNQNSAKRLMSSLRKDVRRGLISREDLRAALRAYDDLQTVPNRTLVKGKTDEDWIKNQLYFEDKLKLRRSEKGLKPRYKSTQKVKRKIKLKRQQDFSLFKLGDNLEKKLNTVAFLSFAGLDVEPIGGGRYLYESNRLGNLDLRGQQSTFKSHSLPRNSSEQKQHLRYFGETPPERREGATGLTTIQTRPQTLITGLAGTLTGNRFFFETPLVASKVNKKNIWKGGSPTQSRHSLLQHYKKSSTQSKDTGSLTEDELWSKIKITLLGLNAYPRFRTTTTDDARQEKSEYFIANAKKNFEKIRNRELKSLMDSASVRQFRVGILKSPNQFKHLQDDLKLRQIRPTLLNIKKPWAAPVDTSRAWFGNKLLTKNPGKRFIYNKPVEVLSQIELNYETPWSSRPSPYTWSDSTNVLETEPYSRLNQHDHRVALKKIPEYADYLKFKQGFETKSNRGLFFSTIGGVQDWKAGYLDKSELSYPDLRYQTGYHRTGTWKERKPSEKNQNKHPASLDHPVSLKATVGDWAGNVSAEKYTFGAERIKIRPLVISDKKPNNIKIRTGFKKPTNSSATLLGLSSELKPLQTRRSPNYATTIVSDSNFPRTPYWGRELKKKKDVTLEKGIQTTPVNSQKFEASVRKTNKNKQKQGDGIGEGSNPLGLKDFSLEKIDCATKVSRVGSDVTKNDYVKSHKLKTRKTWDGNLTPGAGGEVTAISGTRTQASETVKRGRKILKEKSEQLKPKKAQEAINSDTVSQDKIEPHPHPNQDSPHVESYRSYFLLDSPEKEQYYKDKLQERYYRRLSLATSTPIWNANYQTSIFLAPDYAKRRFIQGDNAKTSLVRGKEITSHFKRFKPPSNVKYTNPYDDFYRSQSVKRLLKKRTTSYVGKNNWQLRRILQIKDIKKKRKKKPRTFYHIKLPLYKVGSSSSSAPENFVTSLSFNSNLFDKTRTAGILPSRLGVRKLSNRVLRYNFLNKNRLRVSDISNLIEQHRHSLSRDRTNLNIIKNPGKGGKKRFSNRAGRLLRKKFRETKRWRRRKYITYYPRLNKLIFGEFKSRNWAPKRVGGRWNQKMRKKPTYMFNHFKTNKTLFKKSILWGEGYIPYKSGPTIRRSEFSIRSVPPRERSMSFLFGRNSSWRDIYEWEATGSGGHSNSMVKKLRSALYTAKRKYPQKLWERGGGLYKKKFAKVYSKTLNYADLRSDGMYKKYTNYKKFEIRKKFVPRLMFYSNLPNHRHTGLYPTPRLASYPWRGILSEQNFDPFYDANTRTGNYWVTEKFHFDPRNDNGISHYSNPSEDINTDGDDLWSLPGLSFYVIKEDYDPELGENVMQRLNRRFELRDTYKKKDKFSFAPRVRVQNFLSEHTEWDETWLQPPNGSKFFSWNNIPFNYVDPANSEYHQPRGLHSFKIDDDGTFAENANYYALTDYLTSSRIRSDDMGYARTPLRKPDTQFISLTDDTITNDERAGSLPTVEYEKFKDRDLNFRDLWWRSVEGGYLRPEAQREFSYSIVKDRNEHYRDFLLSYDYKLFGKSWMQPQYVTNPIVSSAFEQDVSINEWFGKRDDDVSHNTGISNNYDNYFFGDFVDLFPHFPYAHFEGNFLFWATQLRDILQYSSTFAWYYFTATVGALLEIYRYIPAVLNNGIESRLHTLLTIVSFLKIYYLTFFTQTVSFWPVGVLHSIVESALAYYFTFYNYIWNFSNIEKNNDRSITDTGPLFKFIEKFLTQPFPKIYERIFSIDLYFIIFVLIYVIFALLV